MKAINRRQAFALGGGFVMLTLMPMAADAEVTSDAAKWIEKFTGGKEAVKGKISLDLPEIAENGNTVPLSLTIESPMTAESHVKEVTDPRRREPERRRRDADVHAALGQGGSLDPDSARHDPERRCDREDERRRSVHGAEDREGHNRRLRRLELKETDDGRQTAHQASEGRSQG